MTRTRTALAAVVATLAVGLVAALIVGRPAQPPEPSPVAVLPASPTSSAAPTTTAPSPSASASATAPTAAGNYGYLVVGGGGFALVDEKGKTIQQHACGVPGRGCSQQMIAVAPDGRRAAFWRTGQGSRWELATFETATPADVRGVATLPEGMEGQSLAWATDSRGLLFAAQTAGYGGITGGAGRATISGIDTTAPGPTTDVLMTRTDGAFYVPVAWDRAKSVIAAVTTGEGGFLVEYVVKVGERTSTTRAKSGQFGAFQVQASPDAARVFAIDIGANVVRMWPVTDFGAQVEISPGPNAPRINGALWRTSREVGWAYGDRFDVFIPQTDSSRTVYRAPGVRLVAMRPDGTAALVASGGQVNVSAGMFIVDIEKGTATSLGAMDVAQVVVPRGIVLP